MRSTSCWIWATAGAGWCWPAWPGEDRAAEALRRLGVVRIATKYPRVAAAHFLETGRQAEIVEVKGSVELAPLTGLAEAIVDLTATGTTLRENGLVVREEIAVCTARLIANPVAHKLRAAKIDACWSDSMRCERLADGHWRRSRPRPGRELRALIPAPESVQAQVAEIIARSEPAVTSASATTPASTTPRLDPGGASGPRRGAQHRLRAHRRRVRAGLEQAIANVTRVAQAALHDDSTVEFEGHQVTLKEVPVQRGRSTCRAAGPRIRARW